MSRWLVCLVRARAHHARRDASARGLVVGMVGPKPASHAGGPLQLPWSADRRPGLTLPAPDRRPRRPEPPGGRHLPGPARLPGAGAAQRALRQTDHGLAGPPRRAARGHRPPHTTPVMRSERADSGSPRVAGTAPHPRASCSPPWSPVQRPVHPPLTARAARWPQLCARVFGLAWCPGVGGISLSG